MTTIKFTVDANGDNIDAMVEAATKEANEFYKDLPGKFRVKDISVSYDAEYYASRVQHAIDEAQAKADAYKEAHKDEEDFEDLEVVPAHVARYSGWIEFEYDANQPPAKKTYDEVIAETGQARSVTVGYNRATDPKYQDAF